MEKVRKQWKELVVILNFISFRIEMYKILIKWISKRKQVDTILARELLGEFFISFRGKYTKSQVERCFKIAMNDPACQSFEMFKKLVNHHLE